MEMMCEQKNRILMQFHITGRCNLRCKHCYREEGDVEPLSLEDIKKVIYQYMSLRRRYNKTHHITAKGHINITGGEPLMRNDIYEILDFLGENSGEFSFGVLSNGTPINSEMIDSLKRNKVSFVQLSIDGDRETHDNLRAKGDYDRTFKTARLLERNGIRTYISFTANKENIKYLPEIAKKCRRMGITKLWSDRIVPIGGGSGMNELVINQGVFYDYVEFLKKARGGFLTKLIFPKTQVTMNRALQFLYSDGALYSCSAGDSLITVDEFGQIMPCRRMPLICGNVFESSLEDIYFNNKTFVELRNQSIPDGCKSCSFGKRCRGGAKCQSYALYGDYRITDPGCPLDGINLSLPEP